MWCWGSVVSDALVANRLHLLEPSGGGTKATGFVAPALAADVIYTLPIADGAAGEVLATDGSAVLSWAAAGVGALLADGSVPLTADWDAGAFDIRAATLTPDGITLGSVMFAGVNGVISQDNANLFWNDSLNRLGIGLAIPTSPLHIAVPSANVTLQMEANAGGNCRVQFGHAASLGRGFVDYDNLNDQLTLGTGLLVRVTIDSVSAAFGGNVISDTDSMDDLGTSAVRWANLFVDAIGDSGQTLTLNAASVTLPTDTDFILTGGVNGMSIDGTTFSVDGLNNRVGIGTASPVVLLQLDTATSSILEVKNTGDLNALMRMDSDRTGADAVAGQITSRWDGNNIGHIRFITGPDTVNKDDGKFEIHTAAPGGSMTVALHIDQNQNVGIGTITPTARLHVDQLSTTAAIPVLTLDQADVSEEMIEFITTIGTGNAIEAIGAKVLTTTHFIKATIPGGLTVWIPCGTIA